MGFFKWLTKRSEFVLERPFSPNSSSSSSSSGPDPVEEKKHGFLLVVVEVFANNRGLSARGASLVPDSIVLVLCGQKMSIYISGFLELGRLCATPSTRGTELYLDVLFASVNPSVG